MDGLRWGYIGVSEYLMGGGNMRRLSIIGLCCQQVIAIAAFAGTWHPYFAQAQETPTAKASTDANSNQVRSKSAEPRTCHFGDDGEGVRAILSLESQGEVIESGRPVWLSWQIEGALRKDCTTPLYLIATFPDAVRFEGNGYVALTPGAPAPFGIKYASEKTRVVVPLHAYDGVRTGRFGVRFFRSGDFSISLSAVEVPKWDLTSRRRSDFAFGNEVVHAATQDSLNVSVLLGAPKIVIQDRFSTARPTRVIVSNDGAYEIRYHELEPENYDSDRNVLTKASGTYRVIDRATGELVIEREGSHPMFSPTARFVGAYRGENGRFEVVDLLAGQLVVELCIDQCSQDAEANNSGIVRTKVAVSVDAVGWAANDSFLFTSRANRGTVRLHSSLIARPVLRSGMGPSGVIGWDTSSAIDLENAVFAYSGYNEGGMYYDGWDAYSLLGAIGDTKENSSVQPRASQMLLEVSGQARASETQLNDWSFGQTVRLSHGDPEDLNYNTDHPSGRDPKAVASLVRHKNGQTAQLVSPDAAPLVSHKASVRATRTPDTVVTGLATTSQNLNKNRRMARLFARLSDFGIELRATTPLKSEKLPDFSKKTRIESSLFRERESEDCLLGSLRQFAIDGVKHAWPVSVEGRKQWLAQSLCGVCPGAACYTMGQLAVIGMDQAGEPSELTIVGKGISAYESYVRNVEDSWDNWLRAIDPFGLYDERPVKPFFDAKSGLIAIATSAQSIIVFDVSRRISTAMLADVPQGDSVEHLAVTVDGRHLLQINSDGQFFIHELLSAKQILSGYYVDDEVIVYTDEGYYDATPEGAHHVYLRFLGGRGLQSLHHFKSVLYRPEFVRAILKGASGKLTPPRLLPPPQLNLTGRLTGGSEVRKLALNIVAHSQTPMARIDVFGDGRLIRSIPASDISNGREGKSVRMHADIVVPSETRWVTTSGTNAVGISSAPVSIRMGANPKAAPTGRLHVLSVGTDQYDDPKIKDLTGARFDAERLSAAFRQASPYYRSVTHTQMLDERKLAAKLPKVISKLGRSLSSRDTLIIMIAGHGLRDAKGGYYLATRESRISSLSSTSLAWSEIERAMASVKARILVFLDACHSGASGASGTNDGAVAGLVADPEKSLLVIAASKGRQYSFEEAKGKGGRFTSALVAALTHDRPKADRNNDGLVELSELYGFLKANVVSVTKGRQTPWIARNRLVGRTPIH